MSLTDELADLIEGWLANRRGASIGLLAGMASVHYNTIHRILSRDVEDPKLESVVGLIQILLPEEIHGSKAAEFVVRHFPKTGGLIKVQNSHGIKTMSEFNTLKDFNRNDFIIISMASTAEGLSRDKAIEKLGRTAALDSLAKLEEAGIIIFDNAVHRVAKERFKILARDKVLQEIGWLTEIFDGKLVDDFGSLYRLITEGLSSEAILRIHRILVAAADEIDSIIDDPKNHGPHVMGYGIVSTFIDTPLRMESPQ